MMKLVTIAEAAAIPKATKAMREEMEWWLSYCKKRLVEVEEEDNFSLGKFLHTHPDVAGVVSNIVTRHRHIELLRCNIKNTEGLLRQNIVFSPNEFLELKRIEKKHSKLGTCRAPIPKYYLFVDVREKLRQIIAQPKYEKDFKQDKRTILRMLYRKDYRYESKNQEAFVVWYERSEKKELEYLRWIAKKGTKKTIKRNPNF